MRIVGFLYGIICYGIFLVTFVYAIGFLCNVGVPRSVDAGGPEASTAVAAAMNVGLLGLFALQHSIMARPGFKDLWTKIVPVPLERSTYVLLSALVMALLFWQWRPMPLLIWDVQAPAARWTIWSLCATGWALVLLSTCLINHFHLFGVQQVWQLIRKQEPNPIHFREPFLYRFVRHPLYVGWIMTFWVTPSMTVGHLLFAVVATAYILVAIRFEEKDLKNLHPEYVEYSKRVPMLIPRLRR